MDLTKYYPDIVAKYPAYVTKRELCEICHICPKTAYNLEQQGEIPYTIEQNHLIRSHKIKLTDILAYLYRRECRQEADSPYICAMRTFYDKHLSPYVIVDCTSLLTGNVLATTALEVADDVLRVCGCDLKAVSYFSSYLSLVADRKFKPEQHIKVLSNTRPYQGGSEYENSFGGVKYRLPYLPLLEEQAATLKLLEPLSGKEAKTYEPVIAAIAGEVFGDGK